MFKQGKIRTINWNFRLVSQIGMRSPQIQSRPTDFLSAHEEWPWISVTEHVVG